MAQYTTEERQKWTGNPLLYWEGEVRDWKALRAVARGVFVIQAGESTAERAFSTQGDLMTKRKGNQKSSTTNKIMTLYTYQKFKKRVAENQ